MSTLILPLLPLSLFAGPMAVGAVAMLVIATFGLQALGGYTDTRMVLLCAVILLIPLSARICGHLLDGFLSEGKESSARGPMSLIASAGAIFFLLTKVGIEPALGAALAIPADPSTAQVIGWISRFGASAIFCAFLSAVVVTGLALLVEIPVRLVVRGMGFDVRIPYAALRQGTVILAAVVALDLIGGLLLQELAPARLLSMMK